MSSLFQSIGKPCISQLNNEIFLSLLWNLAVAKRSNLEAAIITVNVDLVHQKLFSGRQLPVNLAMNQTTSPLHIVIMIRHYTNELIPTHPHKS